MSFPLENDSEFEYKTPQRQKSEEIASEKFFGKQVFTPEQVESQRNALGYILNELQAGLTGSAGSAAELLGARKEQPSYLGLKGPSLLGKLPTVQERREALSEKFVSPEYEPGETVKRIGEGGGILGSIAGTPIPGMKAISALKASIASPLVGATAKALGAPEWAQIGLQNLALVSAGLKDTKGPYQIKDSLYKQAKRILPQDAEVGTESLHNWARAMKNSLGKQGYNPKNTPLVSKLEDIISATALGRGNVSKLVGLKQSISDIMGDPELLKSTRKLFPALTKNLNRTLEKYGRTNPKWWEKFKEADELHGGLANSAKAISFIKNKIDTKNPLVWAVLGLKKVAAAAGIGKVGEIMHRIATSSSLRKYYGNILKYAFQNEPKAMNYYINKLERNLPKSEKPKEDEEYTYNYSK